jgi:hypothetical protein
MIEMEIDGIPQLSVEENQILTTIITEKEVHYAIMQMEKNNFIKKIGKLLNQISWPCSTHSSVMNHLRFTSILVPLSCCQKRECGSDPTILSHLPSKC